MKILDLMMLLSSVDKLKNKEKNAKDVDLKFTYSAKTDKKEKKNIKK